MSEYIVIFRFDSEKLEVMEYDDETADLSNLLRIPEGHYVEGSK